MKLRTFNTEREREFIPLLVKMPLEERQKELKLCDLHSLAKAMTSYSNTQVEFFSDALPPPLRQNFIKTVKMYKGEIPFPKKRPPLKRKKSKPNYVLALIAVGIIILLILFLDLLNL